MTEKSMKNLKNKNKHLKLKKPNVQPPQQKQPSSKVFESDSDISSEADDGKIHPKIDQRALNKISSEVTDLLASLKKEHGINDDDGNDDNDDESTVPLAKTSPTKKDKKPLDKTNKNKQLQQQQQKQKKRAANAESALISEVKKLKVNNPSEDKTSKQQTKSTKLKAHQKANPLPHADDTAMELDDDAKDTVNAGQQNLSKKKKKQAKKRPAAPAAERDDDDSDEDIDMNATSPPQTKKVKEAPKQNPKQKGKGEKKQPLNGVTEKDDSSQQNVKREHHLKNAVPVYVGNLPINIKRLRLVHLFKKFGNILSIRLRTNSGKSFLKKSQLKDAPFLIAFIYFDTREAAEASLACNGTQIGENTIVVDLDGDKSGEAKTIESANTVVVGNLKYGVTYQVLHDAFSCCGKIAQIRTLQGLKGCNGIAFVRFAKPESCELALKLNGTEILNRSIRVERYSAKKQAKKQAKKVEKMQQRKLGKGKKKMAKGGEKGQMNSSPKAMGAGNDKKMGKKKDKVKTVKEFMGTKSVDQKKNFHQKNKKKNKMNAERRLAQKVAPKSEKATA